MTPDLVFDVGFHRGEDTAYYLASGYRVVAVEANPDLAREGAEKFAGPIADGRLKLVNKALARERGEITFYRNENSVWGTIDPLWAARNARMGACSEAITVEALTMADLIAEHGVPHFAKFDIEGFDMVGVQGLEGRADRPRFLSVESEKDSFKALRQEFETFLRLGYDQFKVVPQSRIPGRRCDISVYLFPEHASGPFGEYAPGPWMSAAEAIDVYKRIFWTYALVGDDPVAPRLAKSVAWRLGLRADWYDTHAKLAN